MKYDVFISHASEDKDDVARPLAHRLERLGQRVWLDESHLTIGDSLRRSIDAGLSESRFGIVILSPAFFSKEWPNKELDGLFARDDGAEKVILPIWHEVTSTEIRKFSPILADRVAVSTSLGIDQVARAILVAVNATTQSPITAQTTAHDIENELLARLRTDMLIAPRSRDLRRTVYELDEHLLLYPSSPNARLLKHELEAALARAERMETPSQSEIKSVSIRDLSMEKTSGCLPSVVTVAVILSLIWFIFFN